MKNIYFDKVNILVLESNKKNINSKKTITKHVQGITSLSFWNINQALHKALNKPFLIHSLVIVIWLIVRRKRSK